MRATGTRLKEEIAKYRKHHRNAMAAYLASCKLALKLVNEIGLEAFPRWIDANLEVEEDRAFCKAVVNELGGVMGDLKEQLNPPKKPRGEKGFGA